MKCITVFTSSICYHLFILFLYQCFKYLSITTSTVFVFNVHFIFFFSIIVSQCTLFFNFQIVTSQLNLFIICKTLKKEGRAFRNIGRHIYIFLTVKSALLLLFKFSLIADQILYQDQVLLFCKLVLASKIDSAEESGLLVTKIQSA